MVLSLVLLVGVLTRVSFSCFTIRDVNGCDLHTFFIVYHHLIGSYMIMDPLFVTLLLRSLSFIGPKISCPHINTWNKLTGFTVFNMVLLWLVLHTLCCQGLVLSYQVKFVKNGPRVMYKSPIRSCVWCCSVG